MRILVLLPFIYPAAKYAIPTQKYHTYLRRAVPTANGACAGEMASPFHMKALAAAQQHHCCCCVQPQSLHQRQYYRSSSSSSIATDKMFACSIRPNYCEYRTRYAYCMYQYTRIIYMKPSIMTTGSNRSTRITRDAAGMSSIEHLIP